LGRPSEDDIGCPSGEFRRDLMKSFSCQEDATTVDMVEHAEMSVGFNYNDWIIIEAT
jgi:hypothetical protein